MLFRSSNALARYTVTANAISPGAATRMTDRGRNASSGATPTAESSAGTRMDPKNVVPAITYLASDAGAKITGRVVGVTGHKITMWREPQWDAAIFSETPKWDIDELFRVMPETLGAAGWPKAPNQFP